jgi:hypothetical protein
MIMLKKILAILTGNKSVDSVIAKFNSMQDELHACAAHHSNVAVFHTEVIDAATEAHKLAVDEVTRAKKVAENIAQLVG